jgi:hypothetical protein
MKRQKRRGGRRPISKHHATTMLGVAMDAQMKADIMQAAKDRGFSASNFVRILIKKFLDADRVQGVEAPRVVPRREHHQMWPISRPRPTVAGGAR